MKKNKQKSKYIEKCLRCKHTCKQFAFNILVRCPIFEKIEEEQEEKKDESTDMG